MCAVKDCEFNYFLAVIDDGKERIELCPNHQIAYAVDMLSPASTPTEPSSLQVDPCELCNDPSGILYDDHEDGGLKLYLCREQLLRLLRRNLKPDEYRKMVEKHGVTYLLHDDFYTADGHAIQPVR